jgi:uncharacterized membrane protein
MHGRRGAAPVRNARTVKSSTYSRIGGLALLLAVAAFARGCDDHDDEHGTGGVATGATCPTTSSLTYENFGRAFMQSYCLRCHSAAVTGAARMGAPADHNFDEINVIRGLAEHIDLYAGAGPAATNTLMPENDPRPTLDERMQLSTWLACTAP